MKLKSETLRSVGSCYINNYGVEIIRDEYKNNTTRYVVQLMKLGRRVTNASIQFNTEDDANAFIESFEQSNSACLRDLDASELLSLIEHLRDTKDEMDLINAGRKRNGFV